MENPEKLNLTSEEVDRLGKALKDERFRDMLHEYVQEISDPETRRQYEEEMTLLEQQRGNSVQFVHPTPFKALRTSVDGKHKCFINVCASDTVAKPECKAAVSEDGRRGQQWTLPHSLLPGRQEVDPKGNKVMIYDVVFHPDTLHIAGKNTRFMDMVVSTAVNAIQNTLKVTLDVNNVRRLNAKYKGTPQPCVIRKPMSGFQAPEEPDPVTFPARDEIRPNTTDPKADGVQVQPREASAPTKPRFTVKYRSFVDLQDFRCSRDSAPSPRPKEIVVAVDLPLLKSVKDANLEVKDRRLLLDSKKPVYRLELPLAYPVDEDKGQATFNKQRGQLTVTLPVLPSTEAWDYATLGRQGAQGSDGGDDEEEDDRENERGRTTGVEELGGVKEEEEEEELKQQTRLGEDQGELEGEEQNVEGEEELEEQMTKVLEDEEQNVEGEEELEEQMTKVLEGEEQTVECEEQEEEIRNKLEGEEQNIEAEEQKVEGEEELEEQMIEELEGEEQNVGHEEGLEEQMTKVLKGEEQNVECEEQEEQIRNKLEGEEQQVEGEEELEEQMIEVLEGKEQNVECDEREEQIRNKLEGEEQQVEGEEELEEQMIKELEGEGLGKGVKGEKDTCRKQRTEGEESEGGEVIHVEETTWKKENREGEEEEGGRGHDRKLAEIHDEERKEERGERKQGREEGEESSGESENTRENVKADDSEAASISPGDDSVSGPGGQRDESEDTDEDDLQTEQVFHAKGPEEAAAVVTGAAVLREQDGDGNEKVIVDHSTSAGFVFQNKLIYALD